MKINTTTTSSGGGSSSSPKVETKTKEETKREKERNDDREDDRGSSREVESIQFKSSKAYKSLNAELKDFVDVAYELISVGGEEEAKQFASALEQAQSVADPYYKTQLALAKAEIIGSIAEKNKDFELRSEVIKRTRDELLADVKSNREFLDLEQQAEIARTIKTYDEDLLSIADEAAERGLTFATGARSRALAEVKRKEQFGEVIQSNTRKHNFQMKELELKASRGDTDAIKKLEELSSSKTFGLQQIGRAAEEVLGSDRVDELGLGSVYKKVGGSIGKIEEEKRRKIIEDTAGYMNLQRGFI